VVIIRSPCLAIPVSKATSLARLKTLSRSRTAGLMTVRTPQTRERRLAMVSEGVTAMIGWLGLYFETRRAVVPPVVKAMIALARTW